MAPAPAAGAGEGRRLEALSAALRGLAIPVVARIEKGSLVMDVRCLDDEAAFVGQLDRLVP